MWEVRKGPDFLFRNLHKQDSSPYGKGVYGTLHAGAILGHGGRNFRIFLRAVPFFYKQNASGYLYSAKRTI